MTKKKICPECNKQFARLDQVISELQSAIYDVEEAADELRDEGDAEDDRTHAEPLRELIRRFLDQNDFGATDYQRDCLIADMRAGLR